MDTKTKILKILPYYLIALVLVVSTQTAALLYSLNFRQTADASQAGLPQVLGANTQAGGLIRGAGASQIKTISQINNPDLSNISAQSFLVFDLESGQELLAKSSGQKVAIASLTKLMTALAAYNSSNLNLTFKITNNDVLNVKPNLGLKVGDEVTALDIFNAMLIGSCNDAALALSDFASQASGQDFVALMNRQAAALGMQNTSFANPMGFDSDNNYSTAQDLKLLITATQKLSAFTDLGRRIGYEFRGADGKIYSTVATNTLLKDHPDIQAIKTGFTNEASGAMATKVAISGHQVVILVLGSQNRESDTLKLKAAVESSFNWN